MYQASAKDVYFDTLYFELKLLHHTWKVQRDYSKQSYSEITFWYISSFPTTKFWCLGKAKVTPKTTSKCHETLWFYMNHYEMLQNFRRSRKCSYKRPPDTENGSILWVYQKWLQSEKIFLNFSTAMLNRSLWSRSFPWKEQPWEDRKASSVVS